ncbi:MAG: hypothetical protein M1499_03230 [Firmicutes bacterium]|nr:hypothetical protein [Bacillota bacterium]
MTAIGIVVYIFYFSKDPNRSWRDVKSGLWLVVYFVFILLMANSGHLVGTISIKTPWDDIIVAVVSIAFYYWALDSGHHTESMPEAHQVAEEAKSINR